MAGLALSAVASAKAEPGPPSSSRGSAMEKRFSPRRHKGTRKFTKLFVVLRRPWCLCGERRGPPRAPTCAHWVAGSRPAMTNLGRSPRLRVSRIEGRMRVVFRSCRTPCGTRCGTLDPCLTFLTSRPCPRVLGRSHTQPWERNSAVCNFPSALSVGAESVDLRCK